MSRIKEIWKNRRLIAEGIWNAIFRKQYVEKIAASRIAICNECDELDVEGDDCAFAGTQPCCKECGCSLAYKTRSLSSSCPFEYWVAVEEAEEDDEDDEEYFDNE